jgi:16S rRNA processing protein RimM
MYLVGKITKTHGVKGEVKIISYSDFARFDKGNQLIISNRLFTIESLRRQQELYLIKFVGYDNLNDVESLRGLDVYATEEIDRELENDEYHLPKLIGLKVYDRHQNLIGTVKYVNEVPQGFMLEIINSHNKKILIPFIKEFIGEVTDELIVINTIEGLV